MNGAVLFGAGVAGSVFYTVYAAPNQAKKLGMPLIKPLPWLTGWRLSHVVTHAIMGWMCPTRPLFFALGGVAWEGVEVLLGHYTGKVHFWTSGGIPGCALDLLANGAGFVLGSTSRFLFPFFVFSTFF